jgi:hypothetical protein
MDLNQNDKLLLKKIVTQLARSVRDIQLRLFEQGMATRDGVWQIRDLKQTIGHDIMSNPKLPEMLAKAKSGELPIERIESSEKYAKSLSDMVTPASNLESATAQRLLHRVSELQREIEEDTKENNLKVDEIKQKYQKYIEKKYPETGRNRRRKSKKQESSTVDKELREYYGIKLSMRDHMTKVKQYWDKAKSEDWAYRYRWVHDGLYKLLPKWKRDVVDTEPEDRITNELASDVLETAQDFDLYNKLVKSLPDESEIKAQLTEQLLSTSYEGASK